MISCWRVRGVANGAITRVAQVSTESIIFCPSGELDLIRLMTLPLLAVVAESIPDRARPDFRADIKEGGAQPIVLSRLPGDNRDGIVVDMLTKWAYHSIDGLVIMLTNLESCFLTTLYFVHDWCLPTWSISTADKNIWQKSETSGCTRII